jgi:preprotein translocase subunit SecG
VHNLLIGIQIVCAIVIVISILIQPSKMDGFTNFFSGTTETFYSHNKGKTKEAKLAKVTIVFAVIFAVVVILQNLPKFIQQ